MEITDEASTTQIEYANGEDKTLTVSYMQSITPYITLGGMGSYSMLSKSMTRAFGGIYSDPENLVAAQWDDKVSSYVVIFFIAVLPLQLHDVSPCCSAIRSANDFSGYFSCYMILNIHIVCRIVLTSVDI